MKLTLEQFTTYIEGMRETWLKTDQLYNLGLDLHEFLESLNAPIKPLTDAVFTEEQKELIEWWLFDAPRGIEKNPEKACMWDHDNTEIPLSNVPELYAYLVKLGANADGN